MAKLRPCKGCGKWFLPERKNQEYHSNECRDELYARKYPNYMKVHAVFVCPKCGEEFETTKPLRQMYCNPECRKASGENSHQSEYEKSLQEFLQSCPERQPGYSKRRIAVA